MRVLLRGLALVVATLAVLLPGGRAPASEITLIKYELSGTVEFLGGSIVNPVYTTQAPGPGGMGSTVTFRFAHLPSSSVSVQVLTFIQSDALTQVPSVPFTGHNVAILQSPGLAGGLLSGLTAVGTGSGLARDYGTEHCFATYTACANFFSLGPFVSYPHPRTRDPRSILFAGQTLSGAPGPGWVFNSAFTTVQASRPFQKLLGYNRFYTTTHLVGTEIGRTVIPVPEPVLPIFIVVFVALTLSWLAGQT